MKSRLSIIMCKNQVYIVFSIFIQRLKKLLEMTWPFIIVRRQTLAVFENKILSWRTNYIVYNSLCASPVFTFNVHVDSNLTLPVFNKHMTIVFAIISHLREVTFQSLNGFIIFLNLIQNLVDFDLSLF